MTRSLRFFTSLARSEIKAKRLVLEFVWGLGFGVWGLVGRRGWDGNQGRSALREGREIEAYLRGGGAGGDCSWNSP